MRPDDWFPWLFPTPANPVSLPVGARLIPGIHAAFDMAFEAAYRLGVVQGGTVGLVLGLVAGTLIGLMAGVWIACRILRARRFR